MHVSFLNPNFLFLLLLVPVSWWFPAGSASVVQKGLRTILLAAVILALANPVWFNGSVQNHQVIVCDRSSSLTAQQLERSEEKLQELLSAIPGNDIATVISIGDSDWKPESKRKFRFFSLQNESQSSLALALETASQQIPRNAWGTVTVLTDGFSTDDRWSRPLQSLQQRRIPINTVDLNSEVIRNSVVPIAVNVPSQIRVGQTVLAEVVLAGNSDSCRVRISHDEKVLAESQLVKCDSRTVIPLQFEARTAGIMSLKVEIVGPGNQADETASLSKLIAVQNPLRVLYIGDRIAGGAGRLKELLGNGFEIEDASKKELNDQINLSSYETVILDDVPARRVPDSFQAKIQQAVSKKGLGLIFSGGEASFGSGGYDKSAIAETLPIDFKQNNEKKDPSTALAIIVDSSGSMAGTRIDLAKQIARLAVRKLQAHDRVGIVEFYGAKHWAIPMQPAANKIEIDRAIGRIQATGGTILMPAIEEAYYGLKNVETRYKHILVLTDAGVENGDYQTLLRRISKDGINVSTVLVGPGVHNVIMNDMANWGKGRFYSVSDRMSLIELILKQPIDNKLPPYKRGSFQLQPRSGKSWWAEVDPSSVPAVSGYVETRLKPGSETILEIKGSKHPVLASWRYGLGRVTTLMTEPVGPGTDKWKDWKDYGRFLARVVSKTASDQKEFDFRLRRNGNELNVIAHRLTNNSSSVPKLSFVVPGSQEDRPIAFQQMTPEIFNAELSIDPKQNVQLKSPAGLHLVSNTSDDYQDESQVDPLKKIDLKRLAEASSGSLLEGDQTPIFEPAFERTQTDVSLTKLGFWLIGLALLTYLAELTYRRWPKTV